MWHNINLEQCISRIDELIRPNGQVHAVNRPSVTISRMAGVGGRTVASKLADELQPYAPAGSQWTIFDRNLIEKVLEDHHLSAKLAEFLPESGSHLLPDIIFKLFKSGPPPTSLVKQSVETIWKLAKGGHVILVGRGANVITAGLENVFHVRLEGSLEKRAARLEKIYDFDRHAALQYLKSQDSAKRRYLKEYFGHDIDDPHLYDLVINTDELSYEKVAGLIADSVVQRFDLEPGARVAAV
jgi:cytidylate kinase